MQSVIRIVLVDDHSAYRRRRRQDKRHVFNIASGNGNFGPSTICRQIILLEHRLIFHTQGDFISTIFQLAQLKLTLLIC